MIHRRNNPRNFLPYLQIKNWFFILAILTLVLPSTVSINLQKEIQAQSSPVWVPTGWGGGGNATVVEIDPNDKRIMWSGADIGGPFKSTDYGQSWTLKTNGYTCTRVVSLAVTPGNSNEVFSLCQKGLYRSADGGENWSQISDPSLTFGSETGNGTGWSWLRVIAVNPQNTNEIYVGSAKSYYPSWQGGGYLNGGGLWKGVKNSNGSYTWNHINSLSTYGSGDLDISAVIMDPSDPRTIYVGVMGNNTMRITRDGGATWQNTTLNNITSIVVSKSNPNIVYAARADGYIYRSDNKGSSWVDRPISNSGFSLGNTKYAVLAMDQKNPNNLYLGMHNYRTEPQTDRNTIYKTADGGLSWVGINKAPDKGTNSYITMTHRLLAVEMIAVDPDNFNNVFLATFWGLFKSSNGGTSWQMNSDGMQISADRKIVFDPNDTNKVYVAGGDSVMMYSSDYGQSWRQVSRILGQSRGLAAVPTSSGTVLFYSNDGDGWTGAQTTYPARIRRVSATAIAASNDSTNFESLWEITSNGLPNIDRGVDGYPYKGGAVDVIADPSNPNTIFAGMKLYGVYKTTNALATPASAVQWTLLSGSGGGLRALAMAPSNRNVLYAIGGRGYAKRTIDGGQTWTNMTVDAATNGLNSLAFAVAVHPQDPNTLYVGTQAGVSKSTDGGSTWKMVYTTSSESYGASIAIDPNNPNRVFIAIDSYIPHQAKGVFVSTNGGGTWTELNNGILGRTELSYLGYDARPGKDTLWAGTQVGLYKIQLSGTSSNQPPVAVASANPTSGTTPLTVSFSSAGSSDPDGSIVGYSWNFGDNTNLSEANPSHTYSSSGTYIATLTVADNQGATGSSSVTISVSPPLATSSADLNKDGGVDNKDAEILFNNWRPR